MIKTALSQYGEKEVSGNKDNPEIMKYYHEIGHNWVEHDELAWCLHGDIEVLTNNGFCKLKDVLSNDTKTVFQVDDNEIVSQTGDFVFIRKKHNGIAKEIKTKSSIHLICDPTHEFYGRVDGSKKHKKRKIKDITKSGIGIPCVKINNKDYDISDDVIKILAAYISDGHKRFNRINFGFSKERKKDFIRTLPIVSEKVDSNVYKNKKQRTIFSIKVPDGFDSYFDKYKILRWDFVMKLSARQCKLFVDAYVIFDGDGKKDVCTQWKENQEILTYMATMAGYKTTPYKTKQVSPNTKIEYLYNVYFSNGKHKYILKQNINDIEFNDYLYCLSVPNGKFIIRDFVGSIYQVGNCAAFVNWVAKTAGYEYTGKLNAKSFLEIGEDVEPDVGDVVVFHRGSNPAYGHVGFYIREKGDYVYVLGGNQSDSVNISAYPKSKLAGIRRLKKI